MNFIELKNGIILNVNDISIITPVAGDTSWLRYNIIMRNGKEYSFYQERSADPNYMPREKFLKKLKEYANIDRGIKNV